MSLQAIPYKAPDFTLYDTSGRTVALSDYAGSWLVLYFYPHDDTPGCTIEACSMRDARDDLAALGAQIVGVSRDDAKSHEKFKSKHDLNYTLVSDPHHEVMDAYGAWGKMIFGVNGVLRKTFIIDPGGMIVKEYARVTPVGHGAQIVADLESLQNKDG